MDNEEQFHKIFYAIKKKARRVFLVHRTSHLQSTTDIAKLYRARSIALGTYFIRELWSPVEEHQNHHLLRRHLQNVFLHYRLLPFFLLPWKARIEGVSQVTTASRFPANHLLLYLGRRQHSSQQCPGKGVGGEGETKKTRIFRSAK